MVSISGEKVPRVQVVIEQLGDYSKCLTYVTDVTFSLISYRASLYVPQEVTVSS